MYRDYKDAKGKIVKLPHQTAGTIGSGTSHNGTVASGYQLSPSRSPLFA
jgi:hypothetical protein